jgi:hypothetical protein
MTGNTRHVGTSGCISGPVRDDFVEFEANIAVTVKSTAFMNVTPYSAVEAHHFGGT